MQVSFIAWISVTIVDDMDVKAEKVFYNFIYPVRGVVVMKIKELEKSNYHLLEEFIYCAIFVPSNSELPKRNVTNLLKSINCLFTN